MSLSAVSCTRRFHSLNIGPFQFHINVFKIYSFHVWLSCGTALTDLCAVLHTMILFQQLCVFLCLDVVVSNHFFLGRFIFCCLLCSLLQAVASILLQRPQMRLQHVQVNKEETNRLMIFNFSIKQHMQVSLTI